RAERHDRVPAQPVLDDGRSVDPELDALVVDLADVHEVRTRPAAGRRVVDREQRVLRRLVVEGEVEADTTLQDRRIEAQLDLVARLRLQVRVPVVVRRDEVDRLITHDGDGGT